VIGDFVGGDKMSITFHCDHCGKKIEAHDSAGGKWGKCPACGNKLYVPAPLEDDALKLAPVDESEEARRKRLMAESYQITQDILQERETPDGPGTVPPEPAVSVAPLSDDELTQTIVHYLRLMADGELDRADDTADLIVPFGRRALEIVERISVSDMPEG
jgi:DNA-directed RNA polymerase subunit RPC12/RpoP